MLTRIGMFAAAVVAALSVGACASLSRAGGAADSGNSWLSHLIPKAIVLALALGLLFGAPVLAQEVATSPPATSTSTVITLGPLWASLQEILLGAIGAAITAILALAAGAFKRWTGIQIEAQWQASLHSAAMTGVTAALAAIGRRADEVSIDVRHQIIADGVNWVMRSVPDAIKGLGIGPDKITQIVESKLGTLQQAPPAIEVAKTTPNA